MGVTHIVIHPTSRLTLLLSRRVLSRAPPRAAFSGACSRARRRAAARPRPRRGRARSPRLAVFGAPVASAAAAAAASSWALWLDPTCSGRGGGGRTLGSFELDPNPSALLLLRPSSELCALCHGPTPLPRLTRPASCAACWLSVSIDTANLLWLAVVSLAAASLLLLLTVVAAATWRGVADGASRDEGLLQRSGGPATRLGSADPVIGPSRSVEKSGGARARRSRSL